MVLVVADGAGEYKLVGMFDYLRNVLTKKGWVKPQPSNHVQIYYEVDALR